MDEVLDTSAVKETMAKTASLHNKYVTPLTSKLQLYAISFLQMSLSLSTKVKEAIVSLPDKVKEVIAKASSLTSKLQIYAISFLQMPLSLSNQVKEVIAPLSDKVKEVIAKASSLSMKLVISLVDEVAEALAMVQNLLIYIHWGTLKQFQRACPKSLQIIQSMEEQIGFTVPSFVTESVSQSCLESEKTVSVFFYVIGLLVALLLHRSLFQLLWWFLGFFRRSQPKDNGVKNESPDAGKSVVAATGGSTSTEKFVEVNKSDVPALA